ALLVLRGHGDPGWTEHERDALRLLGRRLGSVVQQLESRRRDRHLVDELRELDEYRRDLVASITHDLKSPLTAIALNTELLASDRRLAEAGSHPVAAIRRSAERLSGLVDDLLALARTEEGLTGHVGVADLVVLVHDACHHAEVEARQRGVRFVLDLPDELRVPVDADAVARIYANVVSNAVKFSLPEGEVRIAVRRSGDAVEFVCADDGIGISAEDQASVFDMSGRSHDAESRGLPGSGVGLAISHRIVSRLGGSMDVESTQGVGSTFTVRLPAASSSS
ncbi:MAG: HAMP domain-containing sensor histidine kinase, partial [Nocardioides sp.]